MEFREITPADVPSLFHVRTRTRENSYTLEALARLGITETTVAEKSSSTHKGWLCERGESVVELPANRVVRSHVRRRSKLGLGKPWRAVRLTVLHVKLVHTAIFAALSACVLYVLASGAVGHITQLTWYSIAAVVLEGIVLLANGGKCPLTAVAERLGAADGSVSDIFLPKWFADRIFPICGTLFVIGCALVGVRLAWH